MFRAEERELIKQSAFMQKGRDWATPIVVFVLIWRALPFLLGAALVGGIGYALLLGWRAVTDDSADVPVVASGRAAGQVIATAPPLLGVAVALTLIAGGVWVIAPGRYPERWVRGLRAVVVLTTVAGLIGVWLGWR